MNKDIKQESNQAYISFPISFYSGQNKRKQEERREESLNISMED